MKTTVFAPANLRTPFHSLRCLPPLAAWFSATALALAQPGIAQQPQSCTNVVGTTAIFTVEATGTLPLAYQWRRLSGTWSDLAGCTDTNLWLTNVQASHAGDYRVVVTNLDGAATSDVAHLTILVPPQITPAVSFQHQAVHVGTSASFTVTASGTAPLSYQWRLDAHDLSGQTSNTLAFSAVQPADEGDYTVVVTNVVGAVTSEPARLWVVPPPAAFLRRDFTNGTFRFPYYYLMPTNYNPARSYPLVWFFHGAYGDENLFTNRAGGPPGWLGYANYPATKVFASYRQQATDPAIVVWPTLRAGDTPWPIGYVREATNLLDSLIAKFNIDTNRLYVGGGSAGLPAAWDFLGLRRGVFAGAMVLAGSQSSTLASSLKDVPFWAFCARDDEYGFVGPVQWLVRNLRVAGGNPIYTEYQTGGHLGGIWMGMSTPAAVDWLVAQRRGVAPTNEPLLSITSPSEGPVHLTGATNLNLGGLAGALGRDVTQLTWENRANSKTGNASGSNLWSATGIPLQANRTNLVIVTATTTSWAPAYGGNTTFNDTLTVIQSPIRATVTWQGTSALLNWAGGGPPYRVQWAPDLAAGDWTDFLPNATPPVTLPLAGQAGFYRIVGQ
ncbi:MAG: immunoglobulin domain-containing protein [Verrucomicrobiota bacterium]